MATGSAWVVAGERAEKGRSSREGGRGRLHGAGRESRRREAGREEVEASGALASTRLCLLAEVEDGGELGWASATVLGQKGR